MPNRPSRQQRLDHAITLVRQRQGPRAIHQGVQPSPTIPHIQTGFPSLDAALGIGGLPKGRLTVISGATTSGKTTLAALMLAQAQGPQQLPVAYVDLDQTCNPDYLERCGVHLDQLLVARPADARQALDLALALSEQPEWAACVFEHWSAHTADPATRQYAAGVLDHLVSRLARSGIAMLILDEQHSPWRTLLSSLTGDPSSNALSHYAAVRLALTHDSWFFLGPDVRGYRVKVQVQKNKLGPSGKTVSLDIHFNGTVRGSGI